MTRIKKYFLFLNIVQFPIYVNTSCKYSYLIIILKKIKTDMNKNSPKHIKHIKHIKRNFRFYIVKG